MNIRGNKGVTLMALTLTVIIILMLTGAIIYNSRNHISMQKINQLNNDIEVLDAKIDDYYLRYGELPILCDYVNTKQDFKDIINNNAKGNQLNINLDSITDQDGDTYAVIDLERLSGLTLNYGYDRKGEDGPSKDMGEYFAIKDAKKVKNYVDEPNRIEDEMYVINTKTHQIYFPHGIFADGIMYYTHI